MLVNFFFFLILKRQNGVLDLPPDVVRHKEVFLRQK
jgi:hypothetical protein